MLIFLEMLGIIKIGENNEFNYQYRKKRKTADRLYAGKIPRNTGRASERYDL